MTRFSVDNREKIVRGNGLTDSDMFPMTINLAERGLRLEVRLAETKDRYTLKVNDKDYMELSIFDQTDLAGSNEVVKLVGEAKKQFTEL